MRSRLVASAATAATLAGLVLTFGLGGTAQAATRTPVTAAECGATGGLVFPLGLAGAVCVWLGPQGWVDADSAQITDIHL
ncbi:hypothetical protein ACFVTC_30055 [Streptomyces sp. NPDC057950]|uniref:hypothetical protein n=1 Tax=Streptomyces sp. NPDC057950 TaxID=3346288 RepID=UPI0036ED8B6C